VFWSLLAAAGEPGAPAPSADSVTPPKPAVPSNPPYEPTSAYTPRQCRGWTVHVNHRLLEDQKELGVRAFELLDTKLYDIARAVKPESLVELRKIPIWFEYDNPGHACACYHPSKDWLVEHGFNPEKARSVEIANATRFLEWEGAQPWMVMHELAHGYHDRVFGYDDPTIRSAFERARAAGKYSSVLRCNGSREPAYAANNPQEYFAELTEAWLGENDFYPFVRAEVRDHDPETAKLLEQIWGNQ
jgi:hypothetical protein